MAVNGKGKGGGKKPPSYVADGVIPQHDERVATQVAREAFSRERYEFLLRTIFGVIFLLAISMAVNIYLASRPEKIRYFATDPEGGIREVVPLEKPIQSVGEVLNWATDSVTKSLTFDFANYQQQLNDYRLEFTSDGWQSYQEALKRQKLIEMIIREQVVTTVIPSGAPVVLAKGIIEGGKFGWRIQMPLLITYESASSKNSQPLMVEVVVARRPESENPRGLGIAQLVTK
jgi:intracellular multiplication protein IcmL